MNKLNGKVVSKKRYNYNCNGLRCNLDMFQLRLKGLVYAEFEFTSKEEMDNFEIPDFCLFDIMENALLAGGMLAGKSYKDVKKYLDRYEYQALP